MEIEAFRWRLAETIAWCTDRAESHPKYRNLQNVLRDSDLRPPSLMHTQEINLGRGLKMEKFLRAATDLRTIVEALARERANIMRWYYGINNLYPNEPAINLAGGRLLIYKPYDNLADGAAEAETDGFFDVQNEPPWDTWLYFADDALLLCWIPPQFVELADKGISVNPEGCIAWATDIDAPFVRRLRESSLLG